MALLSSSSSARSWFINATTFLNGHKREPQARAKRERDSAKRQEKRAASKRRTSMRPIRSLLFAPANRPELLQKFPRYPADAFVFDLEDGTPEAEKDSARRALPQIVASLRNQGLKGQLFLRTNSPRSKHVQADLATASEMP